MKSAVAWIGGISLFVWLSIAYSATPSDPQKAVGYFFIAWYCAFFGGCIFATAYFFTLFRQARRIDAALLTVLFSVAAILMVLCHPS